jgi:hypothetical protein
MRPPGGPRQYGFHKSEPTLSLKAIQDAAREREKAERESGLPPVCVLCMGLPSPLLTIPGRPALCETCVLETTVVSTNGLPCTLCGSTDPPIRGQGIRTICDACLSYARAVLTGDDL